MHEEGTAADARGLRLDQGQHHLGVDGRVDGGTPGSQHLAAGLGGQRVGGGDHVFGGDGRRSGLGGGRCGGLGRPRLRRCLRWCMGRLARCEHRHNEDRSQTGGGPPDQDFTEFHVSRSACPFAHHIPHRFSCGPVNLPITAICLGLRPCHNPESNPAPILTLAMLRGK